MRTFYGFDSLPDFRRPSATVGSYDGVHGGHKLLLDMVIRMAREQGGESIVLTFDPHPRVTLGNAEGLQLLTSAEEKAYLLEQAGIDNLIVIPFDRNFSCLNPYDFVRSYLIDKVCVENFVVGYNHRFGHDKEGNFDYLYRLHREFGFQVIRIAEYDADSEKVSSTAIRHLIAKGDMEHAARMMPHPYLLIGSCQEDRIRISEPLKLLPPAGDYAVRANGTPAVLTVGADRSLRLSSRFPEKKIVITFES